MSDYRPCTYCGSSGTRLCDYPLMLGATTTAERCERPMCPSCADHVEPDRDYCRDHAPRGGQQ